MAREVWLKGSSITGLRGLLRCFMCGWTPDSMALWDDQSRTIFEDPQGDVRKDPARREALRRELFKSNLLPCGQGKRLDRWLEWAAETARNPIPINDLLRAYIQGDDGAGLQLLMLSGGEDFRTELGFVAIGNEAFRQGQNMAQWAFLVESAGVNPAWVGRFFLGRSLWGDGIDEPDETRFTLEAALSVLWATGCFLSPMDLYPWVMQAGKPVGRWTTRTGVRETGSDIARDFTVDGYEGMVFNEGDILNFLFLFRARVPEMRRLTLGVPREGHLLDVTHPTRALALKVFGDFPEPSRIYDVKCQ